MLDALSAEWLKLKRHRATWGLVWIFPIAVILIYAIVALVTVSRGEPAGAAVAPEKWVENAAMFWNVPPNAFVRYMICAYAALVFGGEYGWNTWKLIVPHRARASLIAAKFAMILLALYAAFILSALLMTGLGWLEDVATGDPIPAGITLGALGEAHLAGLLAGLPAVLLSIAYGGVAAILTRSATAGIIIGIVATTLEQLFRSFAPILSFYAPGLVWLFQWLLPSYHLANLASWVRTGEIMEVPLVSGGMFSADVAASGGIVAAWIVGLTALGFWAFRRQDLN